MSDWTPADYLVHGAFASHADLTSASANLHDRAGCPVIVATVSARYLLPSLSTAVSPDPAWGAAAVERLKDELQAALKPMPNDDKLPFVVERVKASLIEAGVSQPAAQVFGGDLERSGKLAVVIGTGHALSDDPAIAAKAEEVATCVFGSRPAAFTRDNSLEGSILYHSAPDEFRASATAWVDDPAIRSSEPLIDFARDTLGASAVVVYEGASTDALKLRRHETATLMPLPSWIPDVVDLVPGVPTPAPPELGGSQFSHLGELVNLCATKNLRLLGVVAESNWVFALPYGFDPLARSPVGVLCMVWNSREPRARMLGVYEMSVSRMVGLHLAREYDERMTAESVHLVTSQLSYISNLPSEPAVGALDSCSDELSGRRDVGLVAKSVSHILHGLVDLSGAMAVTCRLVAGAEGGPFSRYLLRLHCEGEANAKDSPANIALAEWRSSVNAWVAVHGRPVYLRSLEHDDTTGKSLSPDLADYEGLEGVSIYRDDVGSELCVPIFAEKRVVGTVNLEASGPDHFGSTGRTVAEYAQLIGIALLESRRRIGVETITEAGGFLDHRHRLESDLKKLESRIMSEAGLDDARRAAYSSDIGELIDIVFMRRVPVSDPPARDLTVQSVLESAMKAVSWADAEEDFAALMLGPSEEWRAAAETHLGEDAADALKFAVGQALHNALSHGGVSLYLAKRRHVAMFRLQRLKVGGTPNVYVAVSSTGSPAELRDVDSQRVFREPLDHADEERVSLGAFLAGEAVRRCGGSAYLRVDFGLRSVAIVDAEFSVPAVP